MHRWCLRKALCTGDIEVILEVAGFLISLNLTCYGNRIHAHIRG